MKKLHRIIILYLLVATFLIAFFNINQTKADFTDGITGRFVNVTFIEKFTDTISGATPFYCVEMKFDGSDSVEIYNGFEEYKLSYRKAGVDYILQNAVQENDIPFMFMNDSTIILIDTISTGSPGMSVFYKANDTDFSASGRKWLIDFYLNESMIAGNYLVINPNAPGKHVIFRSNGTIIGLENFTGYSICYNGDCLGETVPVSNTITFKDSSDNLTTYAFEIDKNNNSLKLYNIAAPQKDIKGERAILEMAYELRKQ